MPLSTLVRRYVHAHHADLPAQFEWRLNETTLAERLGLAVAGDTSYARNIDLKAKLSSLWERSTLATRMDIARYYVADWGGVKRNHETTLSVYVHAAAQDQLPALPGIASWSKVFTAADARRYAIFDARVALSLNALQLEPGNRERFLFPDLPSQNRTVKAAAKAVRAQALAQGWTKLRADTVYPMFLQVLREAADGLPQPLPLATAEMVLFAHAPNLAMRIPH
jgi:hypothetical protein